MDYLKQMPLDELLEKCSAYGIEKILSITVNPENLERVLDLARVHQQIYCTQGVHPHDARLFEAETKEQITANCADPKVLAVGEIGLDFHYSHSAHDIQIDVFEQQLELSVQLNLPVVIHSRDADDEMIASLKKFSGKIRGVIHSFTSGQKLADFALQEGLYLGFNGIITFNSAQNVRDVLDQTPIDRILVETDSPFLTPTPFRGRENAPFYLPLVIQKIADQKNLPVEELIKTTTQNAVNLFRF